VRDLLNVAAADYLIDGYVEADDARKRYEQSGRASDLLAAAGALCRTLSRLEGDDGFWADISQIRSEEDMPAVRDALSNLDVVLDQERQLLREAGLSKEAAEELLEAIREVAEFLDWPDEVAADRLRDAVARARRGICLQASYRRERRRWNDLFTKGMAVAGGGAVMVVDATAHIAIPVVPVFSIYAGGKMIDKGADGFFSDRFPFGGRRRPRR
jgi:hypothetical protein